MTQFNSQRPTVILDHVNIESTTREVILPGENTARIYLVLPTAFEEGNGYATTGANHGNHEDRGFEKCQKVVGAEEPLFNNVKTKYIDPAMN